jgi:UDP-N-acetyl-D-glucosamine dehydrogenase
MPATTVLSRTLARIEDRTAEVAVIGLGYVGLPLLDSFHRRGFRVLGIDVDPTKVAAVNEGTSYIRHIGDKVMQGLADSTRCEAATDFSAVQESDAILICVPTPLDAHRQPDLGFVEATAAAIGPHLRAGQLVVLESTTYPGTTAEVLAPILERESGLRAGRDIFVAYSPEREDPGNPHYHTAGIPKIVGGDSEEELLLATALYESAFDTVVRVGDTRTAEAVKLLENIFRSVNIALVNEMKTVFHEMGIDIYEVIDAAATKPFGFMPFYPGPGLGGHCIPIDPFYLTWKAREYGVNTRFIELAGEVNTSMPEYVVRRTMAALNDDGRALRGSRILCLGLAYKPDVDDMRESPTLVIMKILEAFGARVDYHDPFIPVIPPTREHAEREGQASISWGREEVSRYDAVVVLTHHSGVDYTALGQWARCIVDTRGVMRHVSGPIPARIYPA